MDVRPDWLQSGALTEEDLMPDRARAAVDRSFGRRRKGRSPFEENEAVGGRRSFARRRQILLGQSTTSLCEVQRLGRKRVKIIIAIGLMRVRALR